MRKWNKLLALVLAMVMVFSLTVTAFAEENKDEGTQDPAAADTQTPDEGKDEAAEPTEGEDAQDPAEGEDAGEPAEGEDAAPAEGEDEGDDAAEPAEGEDAAAPTEPVEPAAVSFSDVEEGRWFYEFVMKMAAAGIVNGNPDGTFNPTGEVTWGQALKMALLVAKYEDAAPVEGGSWASGYIALAKAEGIIAEDAEIDHNAAITRVEMCELLAKALKVAASEKESIFSDTDNGYVMALVELGVISEAEAFNPDNSLTRAELCKILASVPETTEPAEPAEPAEGEGDEAAEPTEGEDAAEPAGEEEDKADDNADADADADAGSDADATPDEGEDGSAGEPADGDADAE